MRRRKEEEKSENESLAEISMMKNGDSASKHIECEGMREKGEGGQMRGSKGESGKVVDRGENHAPRSCQ